MKESIIKDKSYVFALRIITLVRWLRERKEYDLASQLLRAGTGIGANVEEALAGVSRPDFIAKMAVASKEARETHYWLRVARLQDGASGEDYGTERRVFGVSAHPDGYREDRAREVVLSAWF
jgi:four helix bundle protein